MDCSELEVKVVHTQDMARVMYLREHTRPIKNVAFDTAGSILALSCTDGMIYMYSLSSEQPQLLKRIDGIISMLESSSFSTASVVWHPDGRTFAVPSSKKGQFENFNVGQSNPAN
jgi:chromosome transmission fidelity protein 4